MKTYLFCCLAMASIAAPALAQSGTNSPYSQYGLGVLSDQSQGFNRGMDGLAIGLRSGNHVNTLNPASYSAIDSLSMVFDVGLSGQITRFKEGGATRNANNADFEYAVAGFRVMPRMGVSVGLLPFTNIGYDYHTSQRIGTSEITSTETHSGSGGVHQAYVGVGWSPFGGLSIGFNAAYLWGSYEKSVSVASSDAYNNSIERTYEADIRSYKLDFGLQWQQPMGRQDYLTLGLTYGLGHNLGADPQLTTTTSNSQTGVSTSHTDVVTNGLSIPHSFGVGLSWAHNASLTIGADYSLQQWGSLRFPVANAVNGQYALEDHQLSHRHKATIGGEYMPNALSRNLFQRMRYRVGASFATAYYKVGTLDGPRQYSVSAGVGIPIINTYNNRSLLNLSVQWVRTQANTLISEDMVRINIGLTFNERWFMKWKVE